MKTRRNSVATLAAVLLFAWMLDPQSAAADTLSGPSPWSRMATGMNPANWTMPQWKMPNVRSVLPGQDEKTRIKKKKNGLFDEMSTSASNSWKKTKEVLNPARMFPASAKTPAKKPQSSEPGFFRSLFTPAPPEKGASTVTDFLRQDRPSP